MIHEITLSIDEIFEKLDEYSEHIREQIINADNCRKCWNCGKEYVFTYQGTEYRKCVCCAIILPFTGSVQKTVTPFFV